MMSTDKNLAIEQRSKKVWVARYNGVTICACSTKRATEANAEFLMQNLERETWQALVKNGHWSDKVGA